eukprot:4563307-Pyramimonas_sp.AAC.1
MGVGGGGAGAGGSRGGQRALLGDVCAERGLHGHPIEPRRGGLQPRGRGADDAEGDAIRGGCVLHGGDAGGAGGGVAAEFAGAAGAVGRDTRGEYHGGAAESGECERVNV